MKSFLDLWPVMSVALNLIVLLAMRWLGVRQKQSQLETTVAILTLKDELRDTYASTGDMAKLEESLRRDINVVGKIDNGFHSMAKLIIAERRIAERPRRHDDADDSVAGQT